MAHSILNGVLLLFINYTNDFKVYLVRKPIPRSPIHIIPTVIFGVLKNAYVQNCSKEKFDISTDLISGDVKITKPTHRKFRLPKIIWNKIGTL
jgi:hypothetical protein